MKPPARQGKPEGFARRSWAHSAALLGLLANVPFAGAALPPAGSDTPSPEQSEVVPDPIMMLAQCRAREAMLQKLGDLRVDDLDLRAWCARRASRDRALRLFVNSYPGMSAACWFPDQVFAIRFEIAASDLAAAIGAWQQNWPVQDETPLRGLADVARLPALVCVGEGQGDPAVALREIEERVDFARQAAGAIACQQLLEQVRRLKLSATQLVSQYVEADPRRTPHLLNSIRNTAALEHGTVGNVMEECIARLTVEQVVVMLSQLDRAEAAPGDQMDFVPMIDLNGAAELMGVGAAPPPSPSRLTAAPGCDHLAWRTEELGCVTRTSLAGVDLELALSQARGEALHILAQAAYALPIHDARDVRSIALIDPTLGTDLEQCLELYLEEVSSEHCEDASLEVRFRFPLARWAECVRRRLSGIVPGRTTALHITSG